VWDYRRWRSAERGMLRKCTQGIRVNFRRLLHWRRSSSSQRKGWRMWWDWRSRKKRSLPCTGQRVLRISYRRVSPWTAYLLGWSHELA
jgi:hypothetical protein